MPIEFDCPKCTRRLRVPDGTEGKNCACPGCQITLTIPMQEMILDAEIIDEPLDQRTVPQTNKKRFDNDLAIITEDPKPKLPIQGPPGRITVPCPKCSFLLECDAKLEGTRGMCPKCKSLFTIAKDPDACKLLPKIDFAFACPSCNQLFEGKPEMEGRKGKCPGCKAVFLIERHISNELAPIKPWASPSQLPPQVTSAPPAPPRPSQASAPAIKPKPIPERFVVIVCPGCNAHLEVPSSGAGKMTICPACRTQMQIPADV